MTHVVFRIAFHPTWPGRPTDMPPSWSQNGQSRWRRKAAWGHHRCDALRSPPTRSAILFGLCDLGMGCPELGYVSLGELKSVTNRLGLGIERDLYFKARYPLSVYAHAADRRGRIVESDAALAESAAILGIALVEESDPDKSDTDGSNKRG
jgi:hypothetical protein